MAEEIIIEDEEIFSIPLVLKPIILQNGPKFSVS